MYAVVFLVGLVDFGYEWNIKWCMREALWIILLRGNLLGAESWDHGRRVSVQELFAEACGLNCLQRQPQTPDSKVAMDSYFLLIYDL